MRAKTDKSDPPVIILGNGITALGALRAFAEVGRPCFVAGRGNDLVSDSKWFRRAPGSEDFVDIQATPDAIRQIGFDEAVLIPCSDSTTLAVAQLAEEGPSGLRASTCKTDVLLMFQDKQRFARLLTDLNVPHPLTLVIRNRSDLNVLDQRSFKHAFLKPADSQTFMAHYGVKAFWVTGKDDAETKWQDAHDRGHETVLQEYVPGAASDHYYIDGFVDRHGNVCGHLARRRLRIFPADFGNSTLMESVPITEMHSALNSLSKIFEATDYRGIFSAEFKLDAVSQDWRLLEINARAWWYVDFVRRCGVDVCNMAYDDALERPVQPALSYEIGKRCVYPYYDLAAFREAKAAGPVALWPWFKPWFGALQPVFRISDPMPATKATLSILRGFLRRRSGRP